MATQSQHVTTSKDSKDSKDAPCHHAPLPVQTRKKTLTSLPQRDDEGTWHDNPNRSQPLEDLGSVSASVLECHQPSWGAFSWLPRAAWRPWNVRYTWQIMTFPESYENRETAESSVPLCSFSHCGSFDAGIPKSSRETIRTYIYHARQYLLHNSYMHFVYTLHHQKCEAAHTVQERVISYTCLEQS